MPTDVIRISEEAKARLEARKRPDESSTDVVIRLTDRNADVERFIGKYAAVDLEAGVAERFDRDVRETRPDVRRQ